MKKINIILSLITTVFSFNIKSLHLDESGLGWIRTEHFEKPLFEGWEIKLPDGNKRKILYTKREKRYYLTIMRTKKIGEAFYAEKEYTFYTYKDVMKKLAELKIIKKLD